MLCVVKKGYENRVSKVFEKWDLHCELVGEVTKDEILEVEYQGEKKANRVQVSKKIETP